MHQVAQKLASMVHLKCNIQSNPTEAQKINNTANQNKFANKVVEAINAYFK